MNKQKDAQVNDEKTENENNDAKENIVINESENNQDISSDENVNDEVNDTLTETENIVKEFINDEPLPSETLTESKPEYRDKYGNTEPDEDLHVFNLDGTPQLNKDGTLKLKRGRKQQSAKKKLNLDTKKSSSEPETSSATPADEYEIYKATGGVLAELYITASVGIQGQEYLPIIDRSSGIDERAHLQQAFTAWCVANEKKDIPAGWGLILAIGMHQTKRFTMPVTQSRMKRLGKWIKNKWNKIRNRHYYDESEKKEPEQKEPEKEKYSHNLRGF